MNTVVPEPSNERMLGMFFPYMLERIKAIGERGTQFAYYTTADVAASILRKKQFWMRNASAMNDYSEIDHGIACLIKAREQGAVEAFKLALNNAFPGVADELLSSFDSWLPSIQTRTYIFSLSQHDFTDQHGQLSMWRAYGGKSGVAIVIDGNVGLSNEHARVLYASPVMYSTPAEFAEYFGRLARRMLEETQYLKELGRTELQNIAFTILRSAALCTKHPGFREENEWRVLASPDMYPSALLHEEVESVRGSLQVVIKIDLKDESDREVRGLALPSIVNRLIIGPCENPILVAGALLDMLEHAGVENPASRVLVSGIPLRHF